MHLTTVLPVLAATSALLLDAVCAGGPHYKPRAEQHVALAGRHRLPSKRGKSCPARLSGAGSGSAASSQTASIYVAEAAGAGWGASSTWTARTALTSAASAASLPSSTAGGRKGHTSVSSPQPSSADDSVASAADSVASTVANATAASTAAGLGVGLFSFVDATCGKSGATKAVTDTSGPNGAMEWLNCGLYDDAGWTPPDIAMDDLLVTDLSTALKDSSSPYSACAAYLDIFEKYASEFNLPSILLAAIAMQESSCDPNASGDNGGAYGLMQITEDKCTAGISCSDPDYNVKTGAKYFADTLAANDNNLLLTIGAYNGWYKGLTVAKATAIKSSCCECQQNLNYMQQMLNGWFQNKDGSQLGNWDMGCGQSSY